MDSKTESKGFIAKLLSFKGMIAVATVGIWILVLQNFGVIPVSQNVKVTNVIAVEGRVRADVSGTVSVDNTVDVNLSEINGYRNCFYNSDYKHPKDYYRIPVFTY